MGEPVVDADRSALRGRQIDRLRRLLTEALPGNRFYARKLAAAGVCPDDLRSAADVPCLPFTTKAELAADQAEHPPYGTALTHPPEQYCRLHQTSGTSTGRPLRWLDCPVSWEWLLNCWRVSFPVMGLTPHDRAYFPFSFGPFLGFWSAFEAASRHGCLCLPGGGMTSTARLRFLIEHRATVVFATPTYALHLAELAAAEGIDLAGSDVRAVVVAGEPGGNIPATRERIEEVWGARVFDHYGMTEVGPVAIECEADPGSMLVLESEYLAEVLTPNGDHPASDGEVGELVVTNLGRVGSPLIRYRTGDLVRAEPDPPPLPGVPRWLRLRGGVLGRVDDMIHVRGNNLYPTAIEAVVRRFPEVIEFRIVIDQTGPLPDLRVEVEPSDPASGARLAEAVARAVRDDLLFRVEVCPVPPGTLPRFEMKARRVVQIQSAT
ncbi:MAG TPA: AMP-binding protein [Fimbriiglobus sp.]|jgi:phenylacetate-CoA ligase|nr:AMP-binding protein [Fimbriiglobus sp.]